MKIEVRPLSRHKRKGKKSYSPVGEQFKLIRTGIDFSNIDKRKQVILITSPESGTGKSTIASHLAITYAQRGERVLLIDADMRRPTLHRRFSKDLHAGLSNIILGYLSVEEGLQNVALADCEFFILTSGSIPPNPSELLSSEKMIELLEKLREEFDYIIIDTPPVTIVSDALALADMVDGMILVCRYHKTLRAKAIQAVEKLSLSQTKILGAIFNGTKNMENYYY
ncbi:CpsD/CapB family tyrosine-protein kinase [Listeria grandensis]|uniref:CpsD/CapB family tyrosine-protein kinase n=1 Tax=Listeria grandensis TaxID=1494963 RepID=UPI00055D77FE|nr:CpsD/CapB family tyrosine-protein kinase [Listeria grandensis]MBC1474471.1 CpsD/CapB family tyrosine-protein kinase [Listeria grandensis]